MPKARKRTRKPYKLQVALLCVTGVLLMLWLTMTLLVPRNLFQVPYSTLLYSREDKLLGARIATDGQWRFPPAEVVPEKFTVCLLAYEDKRFYYHPGVDPSALLRAIRQNTKAGKTISGGSTLTMQLARLARGNRERTIYEKWTETCWAIYMESRYSKSEILALYASHAPFGGNVVGLETASWRYFGKEARLLSWAESATLAVLPNAPALIHPGRNRDALRKKRDRLLFRLKENQVITETEYELACSEPLPEAPVPLPDEAPHLLQRMAAHYEVARLGSSIQYNLQLQTQRIVDRYALQNASNHIRNAAAIIADVETGEVLAYAGNVRFKSEARFGNSVDIITSERSTGSILKPFLYAGMLHEGMLLPSSLVADTPLYINGFAPQNFSRTFHGAVPARLALERSLNVPLVRMLSQYHTGRFMTLLKSCGMTTLRFSEDHYGASLILGGAEGTLWDMAGMYASMARSLKHYNPLAKKPPATIYPLSLVPTGDRSRQGTPAVLSAAALWHTLEAMSGLSRPEEEAEWGQFRSMKKIAWKTGTSYGGRDAWAIGVTPEFVVAVWVGNASGEGRPGLTGVGHAAPVMFDLFSLLPGSNWFKTPYEDMEAVAVCRHSGHKASDLCQTVDTLYVPRAGINTVLCPYHQLVHLSPDGRYRVDSSCEEMENIVTQSWFVLPPAQEYYYRNHHMEYRPLPPLRTGCAGSGSPQLDIIYPQHGSSLVLPRGFTGESEQFIFRAAHIRNDAVLYWHLDEAFLGATETDHRIACRADKGDHVLMIIDQDGQERRIAFSIK